MAQEEPTTFHRGPLVDQWTLEYDQNPVKVTLDSFEVPHDPRGSSGPVVIIDGDLGRGSLDYSELEVADARRLALAMLRACEVIEPTVTPLPTTSASGHPAWCTGHDRFDDGSDDWHRSPDLAAGGVQFFLSTGTNSGEPEVFVTDVPDEGMSLESAQALATALFATVAAARLGAQR
jgi:hypothetical protein